MFSSSQEEHCAPSKDPVKYGELVVLGWVDPLWYLFWDNFTLQKLLSERESGYFEEYLEEVSQEGTHVANLATWLSFENKAWTTSNLSLYTANLVYTAQPIDILINYQLGNPSAHVTPQTQSQTS